MLNAPWLPFLMMLLPANVMTMVMYAFRAGKAHHRKRSVFVMRWNIPPSVWRWSALKAVATGQQSAVQFPRLQPDGVQSLTFQQLTWPEDLNTDLEQLEQLVNGDINTYTLEKRYYTRTGSGLGAACRLRRAPCRRLAALFYRPD
jgi:hypothetical protein